MATNRLLYVQRKTYKTKPPAWIVVEDVSYVNWQRWTKKVAGPFETRDAAYAAKVLLESIHDHREP